MDLADINKSGIRPLDLRVLVDIEMMEEVTKGGVFIPQQVRENEKYASIRATVLATGRNAYKDWADEDTPKVGEKIMIAKFGGVNVKGNDGKEYRIINDEDTMAVLS